VLLDSYAVNDDANGPVIAGLAIGIAFVLGFSIFGYMAVCGGSGAQYSAVSLEQIVGFSDMAAYGTVVNVELVAPSKTDSSGTTYREFQTLVTILTDAYLFDKNGKYPAFITFSDSGSGCVSVLKSTLPGHSCGAQYNKGERSLFFIYDLDGSWGSSGFSSKFEIIEDDNGEKYLQSISNKGRDISPIPLALYEQQVKGLIT